MKKSDQTVDNEILQNDSAMEADPQPQAAGGRPGAPLLDMRAITKDFPAGRVLHGVDFRLEAGQVHALVGQNGAGKSTLMKILAGLFPDYGGEILVNGEPAHMTSPRRALDHGIAVIYQEFALAPDLTVAENIALGREPSLGVPGTVSHRRLAERSRQEIARLGIDLPLDRPISELSVADQQLTEIVKALSRNARVLVMDEPTARLSSHERNRLFAIMGRLAADGVGIVYISHFLEEIFSVAEKVTVLRDGHVVAQQPLSEIDISQLARLMVGEKFREIEIGTRANAENHHEDQEPALTVEDLAVEGVVAPTSFVLKRGSVLGLAGLLSSGRTDLADAIVGSHRHHRSGRIKTSHFSGLPANPRAALSAGILMLPANRKTQGILSIRPVSENIVIASLERSLSRFGWLRTALRKQVIGDLMDRFAITPRNPDMSIASLSGGNQQKVLFARAAASGADVLILDQPTAGVDVGATVELYDQVDRLTESGVSVLLISDDLTELLRLSDDIILMKEGVAGPPRPASEYDRSTLLTAITGESAPV